MPHPFGFSKGRLGRLLGLGLLCLVLGACFSIPDLPTMEPLGSHPRPTREAAPPTSTPVVPTLPDAYLPPEDPTDHRMPAYPEPAAALTPRPFGPVLPIAGLPPDFDLDLEAARTCPKHEETPPVRDLWLLPAVGPDGLELFAVASDGSSSVAGWRMRDELAPEVDVAALRFEDLRDVSRLERNPNSPPAWKALLGSIEDRQLLWLIDCGDYGSVALEDAALAPQILATIALEERIEPGQRIWALVEDWSGDGRSEVVLKVQHASVEWLCAIHQGTLWRSVMALDPEVIVVDRDRDGRVEAVDRGSDGQWRSRVWTGAEVESNRLADLAYEAPILDPAALPPLPMDVYFTQGDGRDERAWRWPAGGGALEALTEVEARGIDWETLQQPPAHSGSIDEDRSRATGRRVFYVRDEFRHSEVIDENLDAESTPSAAPEKLPKDGLRNGAIYLAEGGAESIGHALVALYAKDFGDENPRDFDGLRLSDSGRRLAWSDGVGLWVTDVPNGPIRRLTTVGEPTPELEHGDWAIHHPASWSPDDRRLLTAFGYVEGSSLAIWDVEDATSWTLPASFSYAQGDSYADWLRSGHLLHTRSGALHGGEAFMRLVDPADRSSFELLPPLWIRSGFKASAAVLGFAERPDGSIVFGLRSNLSFDDRSNGFFVIRPDGSGLQRIAGLPMVTDPDDDPWLSGGLWCQMRFSPDASLYLCHNQGSNTAQYLVGVVDSGQLWDATKVLASPEHGQIHEIAFGTR